MSIDEVTIAVRCACGAPIVAQYGSEGGHQNIFLVVGPCDSCRKGTIKEMKEGVPAMVGRDLKRELRELRERAERAEKLVGGG